MAALTSSSGSAETGCRNQIAAAVTTNAAPARMKRYAVSGT
jgi:hypothetical protein